MKPRIILLAVIGAIALAATAFWLDGKRVQPQRSAELSYSEFRKLVADGAVARVVFSGTDARGELVKPQALGEAGTVTDAFRTRVPPFKDAALLDRLDIAGANYTFAPGADGMTGAGFLASILPWVLLVGFYIWFTRRMAGGGNLPGGLGGQGGFKQFLEGASKREQETVDEITFADVAGQDSAKREVSELVDYLAQPERFERLGAEAPHGVLLMGPPGTGKTLLARALAGEAGVPFFSISASEFIEVFVGVGASRVRSMFEEAKERAPSIIFIDELDSIGRTRGTGFGGGHDEREQTLNQILAEMDGFGGHEAVVVLAATNRPDVLDPALLRPGRFDRHVTLDLPDKPARRAILDVHVRKVPLGPDVDLDVMAAGTPGFSGADLKNLVNEAAILAARADADAVTAADFEAARDKVMMGAERHFIITDDERHRLAVHEAGHTAVAFHVPGADPIHKVTIIPRGRALGATHQLPEEERHTLTEGYLEGRLAVMLAGRASEQLVLGSVSSGADNDIKQATALARMMVSRWGMSDEIGPVDVSDSEENPFLGREMAMPRHHGEATARRVDQAVHDLLIEAESTAQAVLERHRPAVEALIARLEAHETLDHDDIEAILARPPEAAAG
jgi:cell division protease FtsH